MTPLQQLRVWLRRAPITERAMAGLAVAIVLGLLSWALVPTTPPGANVAATDNPASASTDAAPAAGAADTSAPAGSAVDTSVPPPGQPSQPPTAGTTSGSGGPPATGSTTAGQPPASGTCPSSTEQGVTETEIRIDITLAEAGGSAANETFGLPSAEEQKQDYQVVINALNREGGAACRKLVPHFITGNPTDSSSQQSVCLQVAQDKPFAALDIGLYYSPPAAKHCIAQHRIPFLVETLMTESEGNKFYPYLLSSRGSYDVLYRNTIFGLKDRGFFDPGKGMRKLGVLMQDCAPELNTKFLNWLGEAGVQKSQIVTYNLGCPSPFSSPGDIAQAVLRFQSSGVSHVTYSQAASDFPNFTKIAQQQGYHPRYGIPDDGLLCCPGSAFAPDRDNFDGAVGITFMRWGDYDSGVAPTAGTKRCDAIYAAAGRPPVHKQKASIAGMICSQIWIFAAALNNSPSLTRTGFVDGLHRAGSVETSYPNGPNDFKAPRVLTAGQFWRAAEFNASCNCWKVLDPTFRPSFP